MSDGIHYFLDVHHALTIRSTSVTFQCLEDVCDESGGVTRDDLADFLSRERDDRLEVDTCTHRAGES